MPNKTKHTKQLKVVSPQKCIGCELCVLAFQRQVGKVGLDGAPIRILRTPDGFVVDIESQINDLDTKAVKAVCPRGVFEIVVGEESLLGE